jgi:hypothetical protein
MQPMRRLNIHSGGPRVFSFGKGDGEEQTAREGGRVQNFGQFQK